MSYPLYSVSSSLLCDLPLQCWGWNSGSPTRMAQALWLNPTWLLLLLSGPLLESRHALWAFKLPSSYTPFTPHPQPITTSSWPCISPFTELSILRVQVQFPPRSVPAGLSLLPPFLFCQQITTELRGVLAVFTALGAGTGVHMCNLRLHSLGVGVWRGVTSACVKFTRDSLVLACWA